MLLRLLPSEFHMIFVVMFFSLAIQEALTTFHPLITIHTPRSALSKPQLNGTLCIGHPFSGPITRFERRHQFTMAEIRPYFPPAHRPSLQFLSNSCPCHGVSTQQRCGTAPLPFRCKRPVRQQPPEVARTRSRSRTRGKQS
jgi:hypothetical protein